MCNRFGNPEVDLPFDLPGRILKGLGTLLGRLSWLGARDAQGPASLVRATGQWIVPSKPGTHFRINGLSENRVT
jgi:hypothetical protein